jgi:hypothetical protein
MDVGEVSGRMFLQKRKAEYSGDLLLQFIAATKTNALSLTCHQLRAEFNMYLAMTAKRRYVFIVNNFDPEQLLLFRQFLATYRLSRQHSDSTIPSNLFENVTLCLELDDDIHQSIKAYHKTLARYNGHGIVPEAFDDSSRIVVQPVDSTHGSGGLAARSTSMTKAQINLAVREIRCIYDGRLCRGSDRITVKYLMDYLVSRSDEPKEYRWADGTYTLSL